MAHVRLPERVIVAIELVAGGHARAVCRTGLCTWTSGSWPLWVARQAQADHRAEHAAEQRPR